MVFMAIYSYSTHAQTITENFNYTGASATWTVPNCVDTIYVTIAGAEGGGTYAGEGAVLTGYLAVTPGQQIELNVGGEGGLPNGGWNGGGNGQTANGITNYSGGGGGASDIRFLPYGINDRVVVAAGGGGMGGGNTDDDGGDGGCLNGFAGATTFGIGANGGTQFNAGGGGNPWGGGGTGNNGALGTGGNGATDPCYNLGPGGGGGGGYYGGGGGGSDCWSFGSLGGGGGGGGSSLNPGNFNCIQGNNNGNGYITINYELGETYGTDYQTHCDSYTWSNGVTYTSSNYTDQITLTNSTGCDSIVTLNLDILNPTYGTDVQTHCVNYTWVDGNTYTSSNNTATYTYLNANSNGCDSIVTLDLTINNVSYHTDSQVHCDSYTWVDGNTYTSSNNTAMFTYANANYLGCDSIVTLDLTIVQTPQTSAGPDVNSCNLNATLGASAAIGTGTWSCNDPSVIIDFPNTENTTVMAPSYGSYTFYWFDDNNYGCTSIDSMIVNFYEQPIANAGNNAAICGNSVELNALPSVGVGSWSTTTIGSSFFPNTTSAQTNITNPNHIPSIAIWTEDNNGCIDTDYVTIAFSQPIIADAGSDVSICSGESITLNAQGGAEYAWTPTLNLTGANSSSPTVNPSDTTTYTVTITNQSTNAIFNGDFEQGDIGFDTDYNASYSGWLSMNQYCVGSDPALAHPNFNGSDHTTGSGQFLIANGATVANQSLYCTTVEVTPNTEYDLSLWVCNLSFSFVPDLANLEITINGTPLGAIEAPYLEDVWDEFNTSWNSNNSTIATICITNLNTANNLNDFGIDDISFIGKCIDTAEVTVNVIPQPNANANIDEVICGGTHSLNAIPSVGIGTWTSASNLTISDINNPTSLVSVSDYEPHSFTWTETNFFCTDSDEVEITFTAPPASFAGDSMIICPGDDLQILNSTISNNSNFYWTTSGDGSFSDSTDLKPLYFYGSDDLNNQGVTLSLISDNPPCPSTQSDLQVVIRQKPTAFFPDVIEVCDDGTIAQLPVQFTGTPPFSGIYFNGFNQVPFDNYDSTMMIIETNTSGVYSFLQFNDQYCEGENTNQGEVTVYPILEADFSFYPYPNTTIQDPNVTFYNNTVGSSDWEWNFGDSTLSFEEEPIHTYQTTGTFDVALITTNNIGCSDTIVKQITVNPIFYYYLPDAFTPNGDNINDCFIGSGKGVTSFQMSITNRWGETIFQTNSETEGWCGYTKSSSEICPNGIYSYRVDIIDELGKHHVKIGEVSLFR